MALIPRIRRLLKDIFCFCTLGLDEEKPEPARPVRVSRHLRASQWDVEGLRACEELVREPGTHFGIVVRTPSEAAAGKCCVIYQQ